MQQQYTVTVQQAVQNQVTVHPREGARPHMLGAPGFEKSSISLFSSSPVDSETRPDPNGPLTVVVRDTAPPSRSTTLQGA